MFNTSDMYMIGFQKAKDLNEEIENENNVVSYIKDE